MEKRVSLADLARNTGFSVATVSKALRGLGRLPDLTREKIKKASTTMGYYPNPLLASLASKRFSEEDKTGIPLAYIHCPQPTVVAEEIAYQLLESAQQYAPKLGYRLNSFHTRDFESGAQASRILFSQGVQGIILPQNFDVSMLPNMDWNRFSVVGWGHAKIDSQQTAHPLLYRSAVDHFGLVLRAWDEVWKRGYRRIGFAMFNSSVVFMDDELRWGAIRHCLQRVPARLRIPPVSLAPNDKFDARLLVKWVRLHWPEAIIGVNGFFYWRLLHEGFRIPKDFGYAVLNTDLDSNLKPDFYAGMKDMRLECMRAGLELLDQQIRHHQYGLPREPRIQMIPSEWIDGDSLPVRTTVSKRTARDRNARA